MLKVIVNKPALPTLWIDTAIGIKLAKVRRGEINDIQKGRVLKLFEVVTKLVQNCALLCPEGEQEWEYWGTRLDEGISKEFSTLSHGVRLQPYQAIHDAQVFAAMRAYVSRASELTLSSEMYF